MVQFGDRVMGNIISWFDFQFIKYVHFDIEHSFCYIFVI